MRNDFLDNRRQAQLNRARGEGYAGVRCSSSFFFGLQNCLFQGAAAAVNPNLGAVGHVAAEMNRNLEEVRRRNLLGKRDAINKPPNAFKKPLISKVVPFNSLCLTWVFLQAAGGNPVDERYRSAYDQQVVVAQKDKEVMTLNSCTDGE